jgi:hypothetical protein
MKIPAHFAARMIVLACVLALAAASGYAADKEAPTDAPDAPALTLQSAEVTPVSQVGTPDPLAMSGTLGNCRVRCGFQFYWYGGMTESQCCNETQYCPDGSVGNAVAFQPYGGVAARCAP